jgi:hypothetical protein
MADHVSAPPDFDTAYGRGRPRSGWLTFAAVMFFAAAGTNALYGIAALADDDKFRVDELLFGDLSMWGAFYLILAVLQVIVGFLVLRRNAFGVLVGSVLALVHALVALASIGAYPWWSMAALVIDGLIIYALTVHGAETEW